MLSLTSLNVLQLKVGLILSYICIPGDNEQSLLENLQPLTPQIKEDVEDTQAVECLAVHGALASGIGC